ncbi:hypothetical protein KVR01_012963 [Diaporthe batatas]|uniref:uncharacterized protein n=1 Tax=Diaporthe batatas TaxID=748121 RepID=UPI001D0477DF|nr:uncharacterized protein KVR01_012963 [Diaporthe batatas]KAG8157255.1 hypothetical protein KVR01_012963 [Diaporthe batatas]
MDDIGQEGSSIDCPGEDKDTRNNHPATPPGGSPSPTATATPKPVGGNGGNVSTTPPPQKSGNYSHKILGTHDVFWTCSLEEFHAMTDEQWASFGTAFYKPPEGFSSATRHVVQLE